MKFLVHTNLLVAFAAVALIAGHFMHFETVRYLEPSVLLGFFAALLDYNLHRLIKSRLKIGDRAKYEWVKQHSTLSFVLTILSAFGMVITFFFLPVKVILVFIGLVFLAILYSFPYSYFRIAIVDVRRIPGLKNFLLAFVWTSITVLIPWMLSPKHDTREFIYAFGATFLFIIANSISFDLRDMNEDKGLGLKTIPVILGVDRTKKWRLAVLQLFILTGCIEYLDTQSLPHFLAISATGIVTLFVFVSKILSRHPMYYPVFVDGVVFFYGVVLVVVSLVR